MDKKLLFNRYIEGPLEVNTFLLSDLNDPEKPAAIIDPGGNDPQLEADIEKHALKPKYIINTHGHIDHIAFNNYYKKKYGCKILAYESDADAFDKCQDDFLFTLIGGELSPLPDRRLKDNETIAIGSIEIKVIHTPGHTPGSICLRGDGFLISGDTLFKGSIGRTDLAGGNYNDLISSIRNRILALPDNTIVFPGHGEPTTIGEEKETNPFLQL
jgi:hydroxyacylglutathione hydrolase